MYVRTCAGKKCLTYNEMLMYNNNQAWKIDNLKWKVESEQLNGEYYRN